LIVNITSQSVLTVPYHRSKALKLTKKKNKLFAYLNDTQKHDKPKHSQIKAINTTYTPTDELNETSGIFSEETSHFPDSNRSSIHDIETKHNLSFDDENELENTDNIIFDMNGIDEKTVDIQDHDIFDTSEETGCLNTQTFGRETFKPNSEFINEIKSDSPSVRKRDLEIRITNINKTLLAYLEDLTIEPKENQLEISFSNQDQQLQEDDSKSKYNSFVNLLAGFEQEVRKLTSNA